MAAGLGLLRLEPKAFWAMTPRELEAALSGLFGLPSCEGPPTRGDLAGLMLKFPDGSGVR
ncbi:MAG: phage tail assembly chaperone [Hyphomicrobiaceae bacterium]